MDSKRIALLLIAVAATGIFALPGTMSLFAGQHVWYDLSGGGNDVPCEKCHADVVAEMSYTGPHASMECWYCHKTLNLTGFTYASGDGNSSTPGQEAHAASTVECMACHEGFVINYYDDCTKCHWTPTPAHPTEWSDEPCGNCHLELDIHKVPPLEAGGFGLTINTTYDTGNKSAHREFVLDAMNDSTMAGANEACIACHTMTSVKINWAHARVLEFDAGLPDDPEDMTTTGGVHNWSLTNWTANQTASATVYGNTTGNGTTTYGVSDWPGDVENIYE